MSDSTIPRKPGEYSDDIPVEELIRVTREFTRRITNQDRQRLALSLRETGHSRRTQLEAPVLLQQFFAGEIDLDNDLARRFLNAPLVSHARYHPEAGEPVGRAATATLSSQDDSTIVTLDVYSQGESAVLDVTFTLFSALGLRFKLNGLDRAERTEWIQFMRRQDGIAFLWTRDRWEQPYLVFVVREYFGRVYAFSPAGIEAAIRLTPDLITGLTDWLEALWFPEAAAARVAAPPRPVSRPIRRFVIKPAPEAAPDAPPPAPPEPGDSWKTPPGQDETDLDASDLEW